MEKYKQMTAYVGFFFFWGGGLTTINLDQSTLLHHMRLTWPSQVFNALVGFVQNFRSVVLI